MASDRVRNCLVTLIELHCTALHCIQLGFCVPGSSLVVVGYWKCITATFGRFNSQNKWLRIGGGRIYLSGGRIILSEWWGCSQPLWVQPCDILSYLVLQCMHACMYLYTCTTDMSTCWMYIRTYVCYTSTYVRTRVCMHVHVLSRGTNVYYCTYHYCMMYILLCEFSHAERRCMKRYKWSVWKSMKRVWIIH